MTNKNSSTLEVVNIGCEQREDGAWLRGMVKGDGTGLDGVELWFQYRSEYYPYLSATAHPWMAALLMPAMRLGRALKIDLPMSRTLYENTKKFMEIMHVWQPEYKIISLEPAKIVGKTTDGSAVGCFFSGGVDSFYTVLKNLESDLASDEKISHLFFIRGFDIDLQDDNIYGLAFQNIASSAKRLGISLIPCSTNIREVICNDFASWPFCHGQLMVAAALGIEGLWGELYIPATHKYSDLFPWGSHPLIDPLMSTDGVMLIHDGCEATRVQKVLWQVSKSDVALDYLRVCWRNRFGRYNCGECEKCIRTMVNLEIAGVLEKCKTFNRRLSYSAISNVALSNDIFR
ncbi:unnamed protein product, partial [marine sediment metagenome]